MCGIFGFFISSKSKFGQKKIKALSDKLFVLSASRGKEASGFAILYGKKVELLRKPMPSNEIVHCPEYKEVFEGLNVRSTQDENNTPIILIGHSRLATSGFHGLNINNQPINTGEIIGVHNGVIANYPELVREECNIKCATDNDSEIVFRLLQKYIESGLSIGNSISELFGRLDGSASLAALLLQYNHLLLASNHGSLFYCLDEVNGFLLFTSEKYILQRALRLLYKKNSIKEHKVEQIHAGEAYLLDFQSSPNEICILTNGVVSSTPKVSTKASKHRIFDRLVMEDEARNKVRRCSRCLLTENMPFIEFDERGECNYCKKYKKLVLRPPEELEGILARFRKKGGPDCIMGLSGGRDSCYALHYLCTELGMKPVAYTFDWGMVNDLARRNQARMIGKLGIEHIIIAAPIQKKLANIRKNIEAWMKCPDLGMIPLFMAGDKHFFIHLNRLHKQMNINLRVWANNNFERVEFKYGFAGVYEDDKTTIRVKTPLANKAKLAWYYLRHFLSNPGYLNKSLPDTITGFYSFFFAKQNFINLYDYVHWDEKTVVQTIQSKYNWETAHDTVATWRIGDGTAAFYNFIYYTVAGFTENDVFRSNQIREGMISRDEALRIVQLENQPRFDSISDYCSIVGIDFNEILKVIDSMPKLYMREPI